MYCGAGSAVRQFPLYQIDERGKAHLFATLCPLYPADNCAVCDERSGEWQLYDGMPWYLNDLRPIGFLGRAWGKAAARELNLPGMCGDGMKANACWRSAVMAKT